MQENLRRNSKFTCPPFTLMLFIAVLLKSAAVDIEENSALTSGSGYTENMKRAIDEMKPNSHSSSKIEFASDIIKLSVNAIIESDPKYKKEILLKHYFTDKKMESIWPKIIAESEKASGEEFTERELADIENAVKSIYNRMLECEVGHMGNNSSETRDLVTCFFTLTTHIQDGFVDFSYPRQNMKGQAHVFEMNLAYNLMCLLILQNTKMLADLGKMTSFNTQMIIYNIAEALLITVKTMTKIAIAARIQSISQVKVCQMQEIMWYEYTDHCEKRSKRDVAGIGGSSVIFAQIYRGKVTDELTNRDVCKIRKKSAPGKNISLVKTKIAEFCRQKRKRYMAKIRKQITKYYNRFSDPIIDELPKLWGKDETKLRKLKKELEKKLSS